MNKPSFLTESFGRRSLSVVTVSILLLLMTLLEPARPQENGGADRQEVFRRIVQSYIQTGQEEYNKGYYEQAQKTFLMAQGYQEYLTDAGRQQLATLLENSQTAIAERKRALAAFETVNNLIKEDRLAEAKTQLQILRDNQFLSKENRAQITEVLRQIDVQIIEDKVYAEKARDRRQQTGEQLQQITQDVQKPSVQAVDQDEIVTHNGSPPEDDETGESGIDIERLNAEIEELDRYISWANSIGTDTKANALLDALATGFDRMAVIGNHYPRR